MKINRPLWSPGALLFHQQFQQQALWEAWYNDCLAHLSLVHPWGVLALEFDLRALELGKLKAVRIRLRLPDGSLIDTDHADRLPDALDLNTLLPGQTQHTVVSLALPMERANGENCQFGERTSERPLRYRQDWREVRDLYGDEVYSFGVLEQVLSLRLDTANNAEYLTCPLVRLVRSGQGGWSLDASFVPPLLRFSAHPGLVNQLDNLLTQLSSKRKRLMGMRHESNQRMADFAVADVSLFWLLNALNTHQPVLAELKNHPQRHPEQVYLELVKLAGALLTFSLEHDVEMIPAYRHDRLEEVFAPLMSLISTLLEASLPSRVITIPVRETSPNHWHASLEDLRLREPGAADFYLSVRCRQAPQQLQATFPQLCKIGTPDNVDKVHYGAKGAEPLQPLSHVPAAIPVRTENQYFALDCNHPSVRQVLDEGFCAFYVPHTLTEVKLELFAVLRT